MPGMSLPSILTFVDVETTGGHFQHDRIIEVGVIRMESGQVVDTFNTLIDPDRHLPPEITRITGISAADLSSAPTFRAIADRLLELFTESVFVAHNARFDYGFIKAEFNRLGLRFSSRMLDTVRLSRTLYPQYTHHNLDALVARFNFSCPKRHRALADASVLHQFYNLVNSTYSPQILTPAITQAMRRPNIPPALNADDLELLPETPGVYVFYGDTGMPLYVGKSLNLKDRVLSHFYASTSSSAEHKIFRTVTGLETFPHGSELQALLEESRLIKQLQPLYNHKLRQSTGWIYAIKTMIGAYPSLKLTSVFPQTGEVLGVFRHSRHCKQFLRASLRRHRLCSRLLGLEKGSGPCFGYQVKNCAGACIDQEDPLAYSLRFAAAFADSKITAWPFSAPVALDIGSSALVVDNWQIKGLITETGFEPRPEDFDPDTYHILNSFISQTKNQIYIHSYPLA